MACFFRETAGVTDTRSRVFSNTVYRPSLWEAFAQMDLTALHKQQPGKEVREDLLIIDEKDMRMLCHDSLDLRYTKWNVRLQRWYIHQSLGLIARG